MLCSWINSYSLISPPFIYIHCQTNNIHQFISTYLDAQFCFTLVYFFYNTRLVFIKIEIQNLFSARSLLKETVHWSIRLQCMLLGLRERLIIYETFVPSCVKTKFKVSLVYTFQYTQFLSQSEQYVFITIVNKNLFLLIQYLCLNVTVISVQYKQLQHSCFKDIKLRFEMANPFGSTSGSNRVLKVLKCVLHIMGGLIEYLRTNPNSPIHDMQRGYPYFQNPVGPSSGTRVCPSIRNVIFWS